MEIMNAIPQSNWFVALQFKEGYWVVQLKAKQQLTRYADYGFYGSTSGSGVGRDLAVDTESDWETPTDSNGNYQLTPTKEDYINQIFLGIAPSNAQVFFAYPSRVDRMNLITPRTIPGKVGAWTGYMSPYEDPSPETEMWTLYQTTPWFNVINPGLADVSQKIIACWYLTQYAYKVITNKSDALRLLRGEKRCSVKTMGDPVLLLSAPNWLTNKYSKDMIDPEEV